MILLCVQSGCSTHTVFMCSCLYIDLGAVLIFLPGYDEIVALRYRILYDDKRFSDYTQR